MHQIRLQTNRCILDISNPNKETNPKFEIKEQGLNFEVKIKANNLSKYPAE